MVKTSSDSTVESHKESFKISVGVSVTTPWAGASMKHEESKGSGDEKGTTTTTSKESNVFEACGGDTILANNPSQWAASVAQPSLWRVINVSAALSNFPCHDPNKEQRDGLSSMVDMLCEMPGYQAAQLWFVQAVPSLSKYIRLNSALSTNVRFEVESPTNSLAIANQGNTSFYLGYDPSINVTPRLNGRKNVYDDGFWHRVDLAEERVLFSPATYRAPVLKGFTNYDVGGALFGSKFNEAFVSVPKILSQRNH